MNSNDEYHIRAIFRSTSWLRRPAAVTALVLLTVGFPFLASWAMRRDYLNEARSLSRIVTGGKP